MKKLSHFPKNCHIYIFHGICNDFVNVENHTILAETFQIWTQAPRNSGNYFQVCDLVVLWSEFGPFWAKWSESTAQGFQTMLTLFIFYPAHLGLLLRMLRNVIKTALLLDKCWMCRDLYVIVWGTILSLLGSEKSTILLWKVVRIRYYFD